MKAKRALGKPHKEPLSSAGAELTMPRASPTDSLSLMMREESPNSSRGECQLKTPRILRFNVPPWVRTRGLEEFSAELEDYFSVKAGAAEIVAGERRKH